MVCEFEKKEKINKQAKNLKKRKKKEKFEHKTKSGKKREENTK